MTTQNKMCVRKKLPLQTLPNQAISAACASALPRIILQNRSDKQTKIPTAV